MTTNQLLLDAPQHHGLRAAGSESLGYQVRLATSADDVLAAQRLRAHVFALEHGSRYSPANRHQRAAEEFDDRCDHLIVRHRNRTGVAQTVATCRLLPPHGNDSAPRGSGLDADRSFGLMPLDRLLDSTVELGGLCVRTDHGTGAAAALLLGGVARYLHLTGYRYLLAAVPMQVDDGGRNAAAFWDFALAGHLAPAERRCRPREPISIGGIRRAAELRVSPALSYFLRLGAKVCGPPGYDDTFDEASFLLLLDTHTVDRHRFRRLLNSGG